MPTNADAFPVKKQSLCKQTGYPVLYQFCIMVWLLAAVRSFLAKLDRCCLKKDACYDKYLTITYWWFRICCSVRHMLYGIHRTPFVIMCICYN